MPQIKVKIIGEGQHPSEVMVGVQTSSGQESLIVDKRSLRNDRLDIGYPVGSSGDDLLMVELPRETMTGKWRVLVQSSSVLSEETVA